MKQRLYGLYERARGEKKWQLISHGFYPLRTARRFCQNALLEPYLTGTAHLVERRLRPMPKGGCNED